MSKLPQPSEWLSLEEAAKMLGTKRKVVYYAYKLGRCNQSGNKVFLDAWPTIRGLVTTEEALKRFHSELDE